MGSCDCLLLSANNLIVFIDCLFHFMKLFIEKSKDDLFIFHYKYLNEEKLLSDILFKSNIFFSFSLTGEKEITKFL